VLVPKERKLQRQGPAETSRPCWDQYPKSRTVHTPVTGPNGSAWDNWTPQAKKCWGKGGANCSVINLLNWHGGVRVKKRKPSDQSVCPPVTAESSPRVDGNENGSGGREKGNTKQQPLKEPTNDSGKMPCPKKWPTAKPREKVRTCCDRIVPEKRSRRRYFSGRWKACGKGKKLSKNTTKKGSIAKGGEGFQ